MPAKELPGNDFDSQSITAAISRILSDGSIAVLVTLIAGPTRGLNDSTPTEHATSKVGAKLLIEFFGETNKTIGGLGNAVLDDAVVQQATRFRDSQADTRVVQVKEFAPALAELSDAQMLFERIQLEPRLVICGAGHVGASLARLAALLGYRPTLIDDRSEFVARENFPDERIELVAAANWSDAVRSAVGNRRGISVAIVTRGHSEDEQCLRAVMEIDVDYVGLIGSKRRTNIVLERLRESGAPAARLEKVHAPVGLDIGAVTPEEVALAILAEIVAVRRGGQGGSLSAWRRESK